MPTMNIQKRALKCGTLIALVVGMRMLTIATTEIVRVRTIAEVFVYVYAHTRSARQLIKGVSQGEHLVMIRHGGRFKILALTLGIAQRASRYSTVHNKVFDPRVTL